MGELVNKARLAAILDVSQRTLSTWSEEEGLPIKKRGERGQDNSYDSGEVIRWWISREVAKVRVESPESRLARVKGDKVEIELAHIRGELVPVAECEKLYGELVANARNRLLQIPAQLADVLEGLDRVGREARMVEEIDLALLELSRWEPGASPEAEV